jgi:hypothetical protein
MDAQVAERLREPVDERLGLLGGGGVGQAGAVALPRVGEESLPAGCSRRRGPARNYGRRAHAPARYSGRREVVTVTVAPVAAPASVGSGRPHSRVAEWAVKLASVCGAAFAASAAAVALAYAVGDESAVEDTWLGALLVIVPSVGVLGSLAAFVLAVVAKARHEYWAWLWLPLGVFPGLIVFVVLGEAFWWE